MHRSNKIAVLVLAGFALSGCSFAADALWPSLDGGNPSGKSRPQVAARNAAPSANPAAAPMVAPPPPPSLGSTNFVPPRVTPGQSTGTFVGQKVTEIRSELQRLQSGIREQNGQLQNIRAQTVRNSLSYHGAIAAINARLQVGTTPGNPSLINQWNAAQALLAAIDSDVAQLNSLANDVAGTSTLSSYVLETTRAAYGLTGAVDEDHRQLAILEDEVNRTVVLIDRLLNELSEDVNRQTVYLGNERGNLTTLSLAIKNGELLGSSLGNRAFTSAAPIDSRSQAARTPFAASGAVAGTRRPLVVIRFDRPNVAYEQALYTAVSRALERRPNATFDLVAVAPQRGSAAQVTVATNTSKRNAESVLRSLSDMGLPLQRVRLSAMTSGAASTNEVHIYVR
jgi:TolA-binding protein